MVGLYEKLSEVKYHFKFELRQSISSMGHKKVLSKTLILIAEN